MTKKYLQLNQITAYMLAFELSNKVWEMVLEWDWFAKKTVGGQLVRAVDSVSANIAEGFGRYGKKDKIRFYRIAFGSVKESMDWIEKAKKRALITEAVYNSWMEDLQLLPKEINFLIKFTEEKEQFSNRAI